MSDLSVRTERLVLIGLLVAAALCRVSTIGRGTSTDEGYFLLHGREIARGYVPYAETQFNKPPLIGWLTAPFFLTGQAPVIPARLFAVCVSLLGIWGVARLARRWWGGAASLLAAAWFVGESYSALWGKMIHISVLLPPMLVWVLNLVEDGIEFSEGESRDDARHALQRFCAAGLLLGVAGMLKQTAIFVVPVLMLRLLMTVGGGRAFAGILRLGCFALLPWIPFLLVYITAGHGPALFDDLYAVHIRMSQAFDHSFGFRVAEILDVMLMSPLLWLSAFAAVGLGLFKRQREACCASLWLLIELLGNGFAISHLWRHYMLAVVPVASLLAGYVSSRVLEWAVRHFWDESVPFRTFPLYGALAFVAIASLTWWPKQEWVYPGLWLKEEAQQARYIIRPKTGSGPMLNFMNSSAYFWTGQDLPWSLHEGRRIRIPHAYSMISRGYFSQEDLLRTLDYWRDQRVSGSVVFGRHLSELMAKPELKPVWDYLNEDLTFAFETGGGRGSYYKEFLIFAKPDSRQ